MEGKFTIVFRQSPDRPATATIAVDGEDENDVLEGFRALKSFAELVSGAIGHDPSGPVNLSATWRRRNDWKA